MMGKGIALGSMGGDAQNGMERLRTEAPKNVRQVGIFGWGGDGWLEGRSLRLMQRRFDNG